MPVYTSVKEVLNAIYARLMPGGVLDSTLAALGVQTVYNFRNVPQNKEFSYLTIGDGFELPDDTFDAPAYIYYPKFHLFSRDKGTENATDIVSRVNELFHRKALTLATLKNYFMYYQRSIYMDDPDGLTLHVTIMYDMRSSQ